MERLTKRHGKHAVQIGAETRRNDPGWQRLAEIEDLAEQGMLVELENGKIIEIDCGDCNLKESRHKCYNCIRYIAVCYVDKYEPKKVRLAELEGTE